MNPSKRRHIPALSVLATAGSLAGLFLLANAAGRLPAAASPARSDATVPAPRAAPASSAESSGEERSELGLRPRGEFRSGLFSVEAGTTLSFDVETTAASRFSNHAGGTLQTLELDLRGRMRIEVLARRGDELAVTLCFPSCRIEQRISGQSQPSDATQALAGALTRPVIVRSRSDGTTLGFRFAPEAAAEERNLMRAVWGSLVPVAPQPLAPEWTAEQDDVLGRVRCSYRLVSANESRVEIERVSRECLERDPSRPDVPELTGTARIEIDRGLGWFDSVSIDETARIRVAAAGWTIDSQQLARCTLAEIRRNPPAGVDWDAPWESTRALLEDAAATDPSAKLRELAHEQLAGGNHG